MHSITIPNLLMFSLISHHVPLYLHVFIDKNCAGTVLRQWTGGKKWHCSLQVIIELLAKSSSKKTEWECRGSLKAIQEKWWKERKKGQKQHGGREIEGRGEEERLRQGSESRGRDCSNLFLKKNMCGRRGLVWDTGQRATGKVNQRNELWKVSKIPRSFRKGISAGFALHFS